ncbi:MarR family winged helix-turn-helix transcriptional regulator [Endozoicomonas arenosclerae]|uniref:MarR family winged helix-turn-helix transcriptional regulator n=1 Tax=Endozoicomonas arenosclerae TaxID=1633495 RepID=UPI0007805BC9|nr:MarR family transcriptional regulator [Endozoicomonas arenosclerae]
MAKLNPFITGKTAFGSALISESPFSDMPPASPELADTRSSQYQKLLRNLDQLSSTLTSTRKVMAEKIGLSTPQLNILLTLAEPENSRGVNVRDVASMLNVSGAFITVEVNKLVEAGYILKATNPKDRRSVLLRLTGNGKRKIDDTLIELEQYNEQVFGHLSSLELDDLRNLVSSLLDNGQELLANLNSQRSNS